MRKNIILYIIALALVAGTLFFISRRYEKLTAYAELSGRYDTVYGYFEKLGREITDDALLNKEVVNKDNVTIDPKLFYTDSQMIFRQVILLRSFVHDSINIRTAATLDTLVRREIAWLIRSNVQDSIINHKSPQHIASFIKIDSLIEAGTSRTLFLSSSGKTRLQAEISNARQWMIFFVILSGALLIYTTINFFRQKSTRKEREIIFSSIIDSSDDAILSKNLKGIITSWNRGAEKVFGYPPSEIIGKHISILIPTYLVNEETEIINSIKSGQGIDHYETERIKKNGSIINVSLTISCIKDAAGNIVGASKIARDITDQKKAVEEIIIAYKEKETVLNRINDAVVSVDSEWRYTFLNDAAMSTHPFSKEETLGKVIWDVHPEMKGTVFWDKYHEAMSTGKVAEIEDYYSPMDTWFSVKVYPSPDGLTIFYTDFTKRKKAEERFISSERRFRALIENNYDSISLLDESFKIIYRSPSTFRITGYTNEEIENTDSVKNVYPEDVGKVETMFRELMANPGKPVKLLYRNRHKDGHYIWLEGIITNWLHDKDVRAIVTNFRDITERIATEEKLIKSEKIYKTIASSIPGSVICLLDAEYRYLLIEGDMLEKLGYSKDQLLGNKAEDILSPEIFAEMQINFKKVFKGEMVTVESRRNGYDIISRFIPLKDENNNVYSLMSVAIDVTNLKNAQRNITELNHGLEEKIKNRTEQLRRSNEELEAFTYSVSHDLRAPLRGVIGFAAILEEDYASQLDGEARRITDVIKKNALKMGNLIDDLLAFSRTGREDLTKRKIDTMTMVNDVIADARNYARNIEWVIGVLPDINGDINTIRQVWINFISNAVKYSGHNENPRIEIGSFNQEDQTVFFVKDNGVGFDMQYSRKLFKVFQRLHSAEEFEGTGVGLALAGKIILKHGGRVWAEGAEGKGATFYFSLPAPDIDVPLKTIKQ